jgi:DNA-binding IclR family transcriptional regulator
MPAHCTAVGKALMAYSDDALDALSVATEALTARTSRSQTDPKRLLRELRDIRRAGIAFDHEEASVGLSCVAAPIVVGKDTAVAALSVSMPTGGTLKPADVAPAVRAASRRLAQKLRPQPPR